MRDAIVIMRMTDDLRQDEHHATLYSINFIPYTLHWKLKYSDDNDDDSYQ